MATSKYSLKKYGPTMKKIFCGSRELGWISKTADGYRARIGKIEIVSPTEEDARSKLTPRGLISTNTPAAISGKCSVTTTG